jgi:hypothetical protein
MNLKGTIGVAAHPDLRLRMRMERAEFTLHGAATITVGTERIHLDISEIPLRLAIPFHKHRRVVAGSLGPFHVAVRPTEATLRIAEARATGHLGGPEGLSSELHCQGNCKAEIELHGSVPGKVLKAAFETVLEE